MIHAPADIFEAVHRPVVSKRLRVRWELKDGNTIDLSDRLIDVGTVTRTIKPLLGGYSSSSFGFTVWNGDQALNPFRADSRIGSLAPEDYIDGRVTLEQGILGSTSGWVFFPIYAGPVVSLSGVDDRVEFRVSDSIARLLNQGLVETEMLDHSVTPSEQIVDLIDRHSSMDVSQLDTAGSFAFAQEAQRELEWVTYGELPKGSNLFRIISDVASSGGGVVWPDESGLVRYEVELPNYMGGSLATRGTKIFPAVFHAGQRGPANSAGFRYQRAQGGTAAEVVARFMGTYAGTISFDRQAKLGFLSQRKVECPYLTTMRCADLVTRIMYEALAGYVDVIAWTTHGLGLLAQLNDRVRVIPTGMTEPALYRISSKTWNRREVTLEAVREAHLSTVVEARLAEWSSTSYADATRPLL